MFSLKQEDCKAICFFDVVFSVNGNPLEHSFGFHVPVILEADGLYYALCCEIDQIAYGSNIRNAVERMARVLSDFADYWLKGESDWEKFFEEPIDYAYLELFHRVKQKLNIRVAVRFNQYLKNSTDNLDTVIEETKRYKIMSKLGEASISQRYYASA